MTLLLLLLLLVTSKKVRLTTDERECALMFVQNGVTYTDCTTGLTPDGQIQGKEWCYVDNKYSFNLEKGIKNWGYCAPLLEYDKLRAYADEKYQQLTMAAIKTRQQIEAFLGPSQELIKTFRAVNQQNQENKMLLDKLQKQFQFIQEDKQRWQDNLQKVKDLKAKRDELLTQIENKKNLIATQGDPKNCDGLIGYEDESDGEGLNCYFYQNENFMGNKAAKDFPSMSIRFSKTDSAISNYENFSLEMDGFIKAPSDGQYTFSLSCDDYCVIYVNDLLLMDSSSSTPPKEIFLLGLKKYKMQIKYSHSVHNLFTDYDQAHLKIQWQIHSILSPQPIPLKYLYKSPSLLCIANKMAPLKVSDFNPALMQPAIFKDYRNVYKDEELYKLADIPLEYQGMRMLRLKMEYTAQEIKIKTSSPSVVYIGLPFLNKNEYSYLDSHFQNTGRVFSVLKLPKQQKNNKAIDSIKYLIFMRSFEQAEVSIQLDKDPKAGINWVVFYKQNMESANDFLSCGGEVREVSSPKLKYYQKCSQSTRYPQGDFGCEAGLSGRLSDEEGAIWASDNEGPGAYIQIDYNQPIQMTSLSYLNRENLGQRTKTLELQWENGMTRRLPIRNHKALNVIALDPPIISKFLRVVIQDVYSSGNNGGAIKVMGIGCQQTRFQGSSEAMHDQRTIQARCLDNLSNNKALLSKSPSIGQAFRVFCDQPCLENDYALYGDKVFSGDSSLCKAAYYMGLIKEQGGVFEIKMVKGLQVYSAGVGVTKIQSQYQKGSTDRLAFQAVAVTSLKVQTLNSYFVGQKLDLYDQQKGEWLAAIVSTLSMPQLGSLRMTLTKPGYDPSFDETLLLNTDNIDKIRTSKIETCGAKLPLRFCDSRSQQAGQSDVFLKAYRFCFTVLDKCALNDEYSPGGSDPESANALVDNGDMYGQKEEGLFYGWNRRMNDNLRQRYKGKSFIENNLALFPPDPKSKWCTDSHSLDCEQAFWQVSLPKGNYQVKVTMGDSEYNSKYFLRVNDQIIARNILLRKNQWYTPEVHITIDDQQKLKISADCDKDCSEVWSRMSFVQIQQLATPVLSDSKEEGLEKLGCGLAYKGGRCVTGPQVENCLYQSLDAKGVEHCYESLQLMKVPSAYYCDEQRGQFKCIRALYGQPSECKAACPGKCQGKVCKGN